MIQTKATGDASTEKSGEQFDDPSKFKFGDLIENGYASKDNPQRVMIFVRRGFRPGRLNHGPYVELTNGRGSMATFSTQAGHRLRKVGVWSVDRSNEPTSPAVSMNQTSKHEVKP